PSDPKRYRHHNKLIYIIVRNKGRNYMLQEQKEIGYQAGSTFQLALFTFRNMIILLLSIIAGSAFLYSSSPITSTLHGLPVNPAVGMTIASNGANLWDDDTTVTAPAFDF